MCLDFFVEPIEHTGDCDCWCKPFLYHVTEVGGEVWVHRDPAGDQPPIEILAEAIAQACEAHQEEG